jgi:hypothetical protein
VAWRKAESDVEEVDGAAKRRDRLCIRAVSADHFRLSCRTEPWSTVARYGVISPVVSHGSPVGALAKTCSAVFTANGG